MPKWQILTGEYPPQRGGVSDYTYLVAHELVKWGDEVDIWAPQWIQGQETGSGIRVHRLPGQFGPRALKILDREFSNIGSARILVQYVPHGFGLKAMNLPFCYWLYSHRRWNIDVMFHEVAFQRRAVQPIRHNVLGEITSLMAKLVVRSARRIFVASLAWEPMLRSLAGNLGPIEWLPVPSNVPVQCNPERVAAVRARYTNGELLLGHFGTYGQKTRDYLESHLPWLPRNSRAKMLLLGRGGNDFRNELVERDKGFAVNLYATGGLSPEELSYHLSACNLMIQPYPDGVSARRGSAMACISHGCPVVTTSGRLTEPLWLQSGAVAAASADDPQALLPLVTSLLNNPGERQRLGLAAARFYEAHFDIRHTINGLRKKDADRRSQSLQP